MCGGEALEERNKIAAVRVHDDCLVDVRLREPFDAAASAIKTIGERDEHFETIDEKIRISSVHRHRRRVRWQRRPIDKHNRGVRTLRIKVKNFSYLKFALIHKKKSCQQTQKKLCCKPVLCTNGDKQKRWSRLD